MLAFRGSLLLIFLIIPSLLCAQEAAMGGPFPEE